MAKEAILISADGKKETKQAVSLKEENKVDRYICCGVTKAGVPCGVEMGLATPEEKENYFFVKDGLKHIPGCPCNMARHFREITHLDNTGKGVSPESFLEDFNYERATGAPKGKYPPKTPGGDGDGSDSNGKKETDDRQIKRKRRKPGTVRQLALLLLAQDRVAIYGDRPVNEWLLDRAGVDSLRTEAMAAGSIKLAVVETTKKYEDLGVEYRENKTKRNFVLADAFYFEKGRDMRPIRFIVKTSINGVKKMLKARENQVIVVLSRWFPHPTESEVYISEYLEEGCIAILDRELFM